MTGFQRLCIVTSGVIFGLIVLGGVVRATESGLGCPDWPRCHGSFIPQTDKATLIEFSHRLTATVAGLLVLSVLVWAWRSFRKVPAIILPATLVLILIILQAGLGGIAVLNELPPEVITLHLGLAITILSLMLLLTLTSGSLGRPWPRVEANPNFIRLAFGAAGLSLALMLVGAYVAGAGYGLACSGWPACNGDLIPATGSASVQVHFLHRVLALLLGICLVTMAWLGWHERRISPLAASAAVLAFGIYLAQALIGAANIWTKLADEASISHLAMAALLWVVLALLNIRLHSLDELLPRSSSMARGSQLAKASQ